MIQVLLAPTLCGERASRLGALVTLCGAPADWLEGLQTRYRARMSYTVVRVLEEGVVLGALHARRLGADAGPAFRHFAASARPGLYVLRWDGALHVEPRAATQMVDGMPVRLVVSPLQGTGIRPKPAPPSPYDAVRLQGVTTLLTSPDGREVFESCRGAVLAWDGGKLLAAPVQVPRVDSVADAFLSAALPVTRAALLLDAGFPLLQVNAAAPVADVTSHPGFPPEVRARIADAIHSTATRSV